MPKQNPFRIGSTGPEDWKSGLAQPEKQWRTGYSARSMAYAWETANGLPQEIAMPLREEFGENPTPLLIAPEWTTPLPDGLPGSQSDVFSLVTVGAKTLALCVEGKVDEPFGETVGTWLKKPSSARQPRLNDLCRLIGIQSPVEPSLRYQLFHRTASAVIEAQRFKCAYAAMIVHSFSPQQRWFEDFAAFCDLLGINAVKPGKLYRSSGNSVIPLFLGWAGGDARFLEA